MPGSLPQNSQNPGAEYASSDFDIRHRLTLTTTYALPGKKGFGQLLDGWKINSIVQIQTPQPWLMNDSSYDFSGSGDNADRWNFYGNPSDFKSGSSSFPYCASPTDCSVTSGVSQITTHFSPLGFRRAVGTVYGGRPRPHYAGCRGVLRGRKIGYDSSQERNLWHDGPQHLPGLGLQKLGCLDIQGLQV